MTSGEISTSSTPPGASSNSSARTNSASRRWTRTARRSTEIRVRCPSGAEGPFELAQHAFVGAQVVLGEALGQLPEELLLGLGEMAWDDHVDDDPEVAAVGPAQRR